MTILSAFDFFFVDYEKQIIKVIILELISNMK